MIDVKIKLLNENAKLPHKAFITDAAFDLYSCKDAVISPNTTRLIGTGLSMEIPEGYWGAIYARSGLASKQGLRPANCVGVVDCSYRGEVMIALHNDSYSTRYIKSGDRIAQFMIAPVFDTTFSIANDLGGQDRGGGFGHTGI